MEVPYNYHYEGNMKSKEREKEESDVAMLRSLYECSYCKRGFTSPQALGGHMNIHRKDRAALSIFSNNNDQSTPQSTYQSTRLTDTSQPSSSSASSSSSSSYSLIHFSLSPEYSLAHHFVSRQQSHQCSPQQPHLANAMPSQLKNKSKVDFDHSLDLELRL